MKYSIKHFYKVIISLLIIAAISSCSSEPESQEGCTDPLASNYNPDATIPSACEYSAERFLGNYSVVSDKCSPDEPFLASFKASITADSDADRVSIIMSDIYSQTLIFKAVINGDNLVFMEESYNASVSQARNAFPYRNDAFLFPNFVIDGSLSPDEQGFSGLLDIAAFDLDNNSAMIFSTSCDLTFLKN